jgi:predicted hotdog family 3-hydroxylacyl-ACP dehydratase
MTHGEDFDRKLDEYIDHELNGMLRAVDAEVLGHRRPDPALDFDKTEALRVSLELARQNIAIMGNLLAKQEEQLQATWLRCGVSLMAGVAAGIFVMWVTGQ